LKRITTEATTRVPTTITKAATILKNTNTRTIKWHVECIKLPFI